MWSTIQGEIQVHVFNFKIGLTSAKALKALTADLQL